jgi:RNA polymerase sigma-70 factor (ECF subfamily)
MSYFLRRLNNHAEAEDMTQEVFLRLAKTDTTKVESADGLVFKIAGNLIRDRARRLKVRAESAFSVWSLEGGGVDPLDPARIAADRESLACLIAGLGEMGEPTRTIFILYKLENTERQPARPA